MTVWQLVCTGPSAGRWPISSNAKVATVNAGYQILGTRKPDAYGLFELTAAKTYRENAKRAIRSGAKMFMRPRAVSRSGQGDKADRIILVDGQFGPESLRHLHQDVQWKPEGGDPEFGQTCAWITSGVLMLWILLETEKPEAVFVTGLDGYPEHAKDEDYSLGLIPAIDLDKGDDWKRRRAEINKRALQGLRELSHYYTSTDIIFLEEPNHDLTGVRARIATPDDLRLLYSKE